MKHRNWIPLLALLAALSLLLSACGASALPKTAAAPSSPSMADAAAYGGYTEEAAADMNGFQMKSLAMEAPAEAAESSAQAAGALANRKIVKHSYLSLETMEFEQALAQISELISGAGGYVESQSVDGQSLSYRGSYYERSASVTARVPAEKLDAVVASVGGLCNIVSRSENMDDITDSYFDAQARLDSLRQQEASLLEILSKAEKLEDVVQLQTALSDVRYQIESLTAQLKRMDSQVTYSYLNMDLREVVEYQETAAKPKTFGEKLSAATARAGNHLVASVQGLLLFVVEVGPLLILWAVIILAILLAVRAILRAAKKRRGKRAPKQPAAPAAQGSPAPENEKPQE